ncbi:MAG: hydroxymethylglutaryl-CoA synthase [Ignavibacteria bacterium RIFOXYB2_FULL_35_12]|nr:MAG: hydroxymethylglutaryl-CoA synthase [Ignavibacteria bacterium GWA2_36_19]OGU57130.1 MAG: hydroxymethylglutaryl-CoA synthase [Ignavibacteria bacterium GWF2_35_20]OGU83443.1 MAG: hydroxymethylglutaryl-CoA synthase [Ignavibacteria bacterium RIFOXYA2_FULL_35_9]OGU88890.1 MAG: hydroxymethylglutaryl-CoA synthase [Ignavibacteria bacterium RIFOXYA12_FULL_35_25]OGU90612.1 MAG: hydroxymethylglutaryl-CoA synthase [Ignavibacteria bacterium RIFOXYC12_FULL_35_11]OGU94529.1 MAG: hydroxymethylglutaryl-
MVGIVGYGSYLPRYRIKVEDIAKQWGADPEAIKRGLMLYEKTVPGQDEDTITISVEAARYALQRARINPQEIGAVYIGSESHPYAVKPSATVLIDAVGIGPDVHVASFEFACKAGTEAMYVAYSLVKAGEMKYAMGIGADTSQGAPGDALEYSASAGGAAFIMGNENVVAEILFTHSYTSDTPDFWRREHEFYPRHAGRFTGEPAYFKHIVNAGKALLEKSKMKPSDFKHAVFHMPNGKFPQMAGRQLGFTKEQLEAGWIIPWMGNTYSGSSPTGLTAILDVANPGDLIFMVSFGSGAGSDGFIFKVTDKIKDVQDKAVKLRDMLDNNKIYLDYGQYAKYRGKIILNV